MGASNSKVNKRNIPNSPLISIPENISQISSNNEHFFEEDNFSFKNKLYFKNIIPVILKVYSGKGIIEYISQYDEIEKMNIKEYFDNLAKIKIPKCNECQKDVNEENLKFCTKCDIYICSQCIEYSQKEHSGNCISINKIVNYCIIHSKENTIYCIDCKKYICEICYNDSHKSHEEGKIDKAKIKNARNEIKKKIEKLLKMIKFYEKINYLYESNPNNKIYR